MKKTIVYFASFLVIGSVYQMPLASFGQQSTVKSSDATSKKAKGIFKGEYAKMYPAGTTFYKVEFIGGKYKVTYSHASGGVIEEKRELKNVSINEQSGEIKWAKVDNYDLGQGLFTKEGLVIDGETYDK